MTDLTRKAKDFAYKKHRGQIRKGGNLPFTNHLDDVVKIIKTLTNDEEVIAAAWLHDVVEDTDTLIGEINKEFGNRVGRFVELESEDKRPGEDAGETWRIRKEEQLEKLRNTLEEDKDVFMIALSDKLANTKDILEAYKIIGVSVWDEFNEKDPVVQHWYYKSFADIIAEKSNLIETDPYKKYIKVIEELFEFNYTQKIN